MSKAEPERGSLLMLFQAFLKWLVLLLISSSALADATAKIARQGVLDLRGSSFEEPVYARGEWEFYWNQFVFPDQLAAVASQKRFIQVPAFWSKDPAAYPAHGYASYRLRVLIDRPQPLTLYFPASIWSAARIFVEDQEVASLGVLSPHADQGKPEMKAKSFAFTPSTNEFDVVIQVSNYESSYCGIAQPFAVGSLEAIQSSREKKLVLDMIVFGALFIMGIYHISLFLLRKEDRSPLWFGLICLCISVHIGAISTNVFEIFYPELNFHHRIKIFTLAWMGAVTVSAWFSASALPGLVPSWVRWMAGSAFTLYAMPILGTDTRFYLDYVVSFHVVTLTVFISAFYALYHACRRRMEGSIIFLIGLLPPFITSILDILSALQIVSLPILTGFGLFAFIFFQSFMLAMRSSKAFYRVRISEGKIRNLSEDLKHERDTVIALNENLESIVEEKTRDIRSIMTHIPLGIFMIEKDQTLHKDYSRYFQKLLNFDEEVAHNAVEVLFHGACLSEDEKSQAASSITASLGENLINFEMNAHALPAEFQRVNEIGTLSIFDVTWNAIANKEDSVERILVTIRDVTEMKNLEERTRNQKEELELIGEILNVSSVRFLRFIQSCRDLLDENTKLIDAQKNSDCNIEVLKLLFINMHTAKGTARSLYFRKMTQIFHETEQYYAHLQNNEMKHWNLERMKVDLEKSRAIVQQYEQIAAQKLGRTTEKMLSVEFQSRQIEIFYRQLKSFGDAQVWSRNLHECINDVIDAFHEKIFKSAHETLMEIIGCLPLLAKDLQKELPEVSLQTRGIMLTDDADNLFRNVFVHLLRNSMDHGIEPASERMRKGKNPKGMITIDMQKSKASVIVTFSDDGQGLNFQKIRELALARKLLAMDEMGDVQLLANLIFDSGLSTADRLTEISGRGIGMNAVRRYIRESGGGIELVLPLGYDANAVSCPFLLVMTLPEKLFDHQTDAESILAA